MGALSFAELLGRARSGDSEAFERLIGPHLALSLTLALGVTRQRADAEDAVQEALLRFHRRMPNLRDPHEVRLYLARIVLNEAKRIRRRRFLRRSREMEAAPGRRERQSPERDVRAIELYEATEKVATRLPRRQRQVFLLRAFEEMEVKEIAELLQLSPITVRRSLAMAKTRVEEDLLRLFGLTIEF